MSALRIYHLSKFHIQFENDPDGQPANSVGRSWIWVQGPRLYFDKLVRAFPGADLELLQVDETAGWNWCAAAAHVTPDVSASIESCMQVFQRTLFVETPLDDCFALGWHSQPGQPGKPALSTLGQWVHLAKSYSTDACSRGSRPVAGLIAEQMLEFIHRHPAYRTCDGLLAALPSNPEKTFDLPQQLAQTISEDTGLPFLQEAIFKVRPTAQMKACMTLEEKLDNISGSMGVRSELVRGKRLLLVDDILQAGITLTEMARVLREAGASQLCGLVATKTLKRRFA